MEIPGGCSGESVHLGHRHLRLLLLLATHLKNGVLWVSIAEASINYYIIILFWRLERRKTSLHTASGTSCTVCLHGSSCYLFLLENFAVEAFLGGFLIAMYIPYEHCGASKSSFFPPNLWLNKKRSMLCKGHFPHFFCFPSLFSFNFCLPPFLPIFLPLL